MLQSTKDKTYMFYPLCLQAGSFFIGEKMKILFCIHYPARIMLLVLLIVDYVSAFRY